MTWANEPPKEDGWYWVRHRDRQEHSIAETAEGTWYTASRALKPDVMARVFQFGPRIPAPDELEESRLQHDQLINAVAGSWTQLNDAMKVIQKGNTQ